MRRFVSKINIKKTHIYIYILYTAGIYSVYIVEFWKRERERGRETRRDDRDAATNKMQIVDKYTYISRALHKHYLNFSQR